MVFLPFRNRALHCTSAKKERERDDNFYQIMTTKAKARRTESRLEASVYLAFKWPLLRYFEPT